MVKFKPTVLSFIILAIIAVAFSFCLHGPVWAFLGAFLSSSFMWYTLGKSSVYLKYEDQKNYIEILTQAKQLEEIGTSPSVSLFPEIQAELIDLACQKYKSIGLDEDAERLFLSFSGKMI